MTCHYCGNRIHSTQAGFRCWDAKALRHRPAHRHCHRRHLAAVLAAATRAKGAA